MLRHAAAKPTGLASDAALLRSRSKAALRARNDREEIADVFSLPQIQRLLACDPKPRRGAAIEIERARHFSARQHAARGEDISNLGKCHRVTYAEAEPAVILRKDEGPRCRSRGIQPLHRAPVVHEKWPGLQCFADTARAFELAGSQQRRAPVFHDHQAAEQVCALLRMDRPALPDHQAERRAIGMKISAVHRRERAAFFRRAREIERFFGIVHDRKRMRPRAETDDVKHRFAAGGSGANSKCLQPGRRGNPPAFFDAPSGESGPA